MALGEEGLELTGVYYTIVLKKMQVYERRK